LKLSASGALAALGVADEKVIPFLGEVVAEYNENNAAAKKAERTPARLGRPAKAIFDVTLNAFRRGGVDAADILGAMGNEAV